MLERASWRALGTSVDLLVLDGDLAAARGAVEGLLDDVDRTYSRFRADSELRRLRPEPEQPTAVSPLLALAIETALEAARWTDGAVDLTVGAAMRILGYDDDFALLAERPGPLLLRLGPVPGWQRVRVDRTAGLARIPRGVELDLGSTGKALAADLAVATALDASGATGALVSLGGDLATAGMAPVGGWRILLAEDSSTPPETGGDIATLERGAMATSSTTVRRWRSAEGDELHHVIDPRTGLPADGPWRTVTVAAPTCVLANAASTAAIVLGETAVTWLQHTGLPARMIANDGRIQLLGGWPAPTPTAVSAA
jgi:thiamine biosynthesis lipoprotein ApbE